MGEVEDHDQGEFSNFWLSAFLVLVILVLASSPLLGKISDAPRVEYLRTADSAPVPVAHSGQDHEPGAIALDPLASESETGARSDGPDETAADVLPASEPDTPRKDPAAEGTGDAPGLAGVAFDLASMSGAPSAAGSDPDAPIEVRKPLFSGGVQLGSLTVMIDASSALHAAPGELQAILARSGEPGRLDKFTSAEFVSFSRLRQSGIDLRYDPVSDRIILQS